MGSTNAMASSEERINVLKEGIRAEPEDPVGYYVLGMEYAKLQRHLDAIDAFEKALRLLPDYAAAYRELGKSFRDAGRKREAEEAWGKGVVVAQQRKDTQALKEILVLLKRLKESRA
ncbi:MAG TPA: tetratricopeptide repeat protein [Thermoplasmata archaeon]|nr:tetratricopeptide repeat protein [Thermoplasmata archaeon]